MSADERSPVGRVQGLVSTNTSAPGITPPSISTAGGNVVLNLLHGATPYVQWMAADGTPTRPLEALVTASDLQQAQAATLQAVAALNATVAAMAANMAAIVTNVIAPLASALNTLNATVAKTVTTDNLAAIDPEVRAVVLAMIAPAAAPNDLNLQLASKLTNSPACRCFNPSVVAALADTVGLLVNASNATLSCNTQGLAYNAATQLCTYAGAQPSCPILIPTLPDNAAAACGRSAGSLTSGATCLATCNSGYAGGTTAVFTCNASGVWVGSLACPGKLNKHHL